MTEIGQQVRLLRRQGVGPLEISRQLDVALATVHHHLRRDAAERETATAVAGLLREGLTRVEIATRLGLAKSTVSYHARQLGAEMDERFARRFDWTQVQQHYDAGHSVRECARHFGFSVWAWSEAVKRGAVVPRPRRRPLEEVFAAGTHRNRGHLKTRLLQEGLKLERCERCGISDWRGAALSLELHHVNGDRLDNRLENLELLCPNCHSQTDTYAGRNRRSQAAALAGANCNVISASRPGSRISMT